MGDPTDGGTHDRHRTQNVFLGLRMIILALVVGAGIMIGQLSQENIAVGRLYVLLVASCVFGGLTYAAMRAGAKAALAMGLLTVVDILMEALFLHYSGGMASPFSMVFCLSIIAAAFLFEVPGGFGAALLASVSYVGYGLLESRRVLTPGGTATDLVDPSYQYLKTYMHVTMFFLVGAVGGFLAERTRRKGRQLLNAEEKLQGARIDTDNILEHMSSGVLVLDSEGKIASINPVARQILNVDHRDVRSLDVRAAFGETTPDFAAELLRALASNESRHRHEMTIQRSGRRPLPLGISTSRLRDHDGHGTGIVAIFQDLTEVRDMQEQVRKADRMAAIGHLSAGIAHEIRNPLASISGSIELLSNELNVTGEHKRLMELVVEESDRLDRIINDFLEFSRMRAPSAEEVSIEECIDDIAVLLNNNADITCNVATRIHDSCRNLLVRFDEEQMRQVFLNLGINACEAMESGGEMLIVAEVLPDRALCISFHDQGAGISDEARRHLFEPFYTTKEGGTGLGLAIANKIVEAHGGKIEARNRDEGGAVFSVVLPRTTLLKRTTEYDQINH
jgi:two-component system sensor histidine kinase PilS (NtrC family)